MVRHGWGAGRDWRHKIEGTSCSDETDQAERELENEWLGKGIAVKEGGEENFRGMHENKRNSKKAGGVWDQL